jgi:CRISPR-associated endonuclease/helicase Cas3
MILVDEVHLNVVEDSYGLSGNGKLRAFQKEFIDCINEDSADIIQLVAPTGAGKTLCFEYLLKMGKKVLLIYPTNALIKSQKERFSAKGFRVENISSKNLKKKGYERSRELHGSIKRSDIILTNPDIFQAIIGRMYINPEEDLIQSFSYFDYIIYDESHIYKEFELSGILTQIALFLNKSRSRVILSSATPKSEVIDLLTLVRIGANKSIPVIKNVIAESCSNDEGEVIRHKTKVEFYQGRILNDNNIDQVIENLNNAMKDVQENKPQILFIFNTVRDSNRFYSLLYNNFLNLYKYAEKDNGYDTNQEGPAQDFAKPILISTNKSEVGLDYPIKYLFMEDGFSYDSFIQRFGRAARHEPAQCYIYTRKEANPYFSEETIVYQKFLENIRNITNEFNIKLEKVRVIFTFRQALAIENYKRNRDDLSDYFAIGEGFSYKIWQKFFFGLTKYNNQELRNNNLERLNLLILDIKEACKSLRGRSLQFPVVYQRGHEIRQTSYDVLSVLNNVPAKVLKNDKGLFIQEIKSEENGPFIRAIKISYFPSIIDYQKREMQFRDEVMNIAGKAFAFLAERERGFLTYYLETLCNAIEPDRIFIPEEVILWDDKVVPLSKYAMEFDND